MIKKYRKANFIAFLKLLTLVLLLSCNDEESDNEAGDLLAKESQILEEFMGANKNSEIDENLKKSALREREKLSKIKPSTKKEAKKALKIVEKERQIAPLIENKSSLLSKKSTKKEKKPTKSSIALKEKNREKPSDKLDERDEVLKARELFEVREEKREGEENLKIKGEELPYLKRDEFVEITISNQKYESLKRELFKMQEEAREFYKNRNDYKEFNRLIWEAQRIEREILKDKKLRYYPYSREAMERLIESYFNSLKNAYNRLIKISQNSSSSLYDYLIPVMSALSDNLLSYFFTLYFRLLIYIEAYKREGYGTYKDIKALDYIFVRDAYFQIMDALSKRFPFIDLNIFDFEANALPLFN